jgi:hypothetical protein
MKIITFPIQCDKETWEKVKEAAAKRNLSIKDLIWCAINKLLKEDN